MHTLLKPDDIRAARYRMKRRRERRQALREAHAAQLRRYEAEYSHTISLPWWAILAPGAALIVAALITEVLT